MPTDKEKLQARVGEITGLATRFCIEKVKDDSYLQLAEKMIGKLSRKRPSPLLRGKVEIWAAGIMHAIGQVNFLSDKSFEPYVSFDELNHFFGTKKTTVGSKAADIKSMLKIDRLTGFDYMTDSMKDQHPIYNMVMVDGFIVPVSSLPPAYQQMVKEAREAGKDISFTTK